MIKLTDPTIAQVLAHQQATYIAEHHYSDCALHNNPAYEPSPCDCTRLKDEAIKAEDFHNWWSGHINAHDLHTKED
jgi:hypothetical protein